MTYAIDNGCRLLTGDKTLRTMANRENIPVSGVLFITDMLTEKHIMGNDDMVAALERLLKSNNRLPQKRIRETIEKLTKSFGLS